jgi:hypothetical protein
MTTTTNSPSVRSSNIQNDIPNKPGKYFDRPPRHVIARTLVGAGVVGLCDSSGVMLDVSERLALVGIARFGNDIVVGVHKRRPDGT